VTYYNDALPMNTTVAPVDSHSPVHLNLRRLWWLRNIALVAQAAAVLVAARGLGLALPLAVLSGILTAVLLVNALTWWRLRQPWPVAEPELFGQFLFDVAALTALLYYSGGATNPFVTLYLLPLALAAASLAARYTWAMAAITATAYSALLWSKPHAVSASHDAHAASFELHVLGMWIGFVVSAALIAWFAVRMNEAVRRRERELAELRERELRHERVVALGALAAGAAHELGTPLATMAVLTREMERHGSSAEQLGILRQQIDRCKQILGSISASAGVLRAESGTAIALDTFLRDMLAQWRLIRPGVVLHEHWPEASAAPAIVADQTLAQAITNVLNNAADASPAEVDLTLSWDAAMLTVTVCDRGQGLAPDVAARLGEPGASTKPEGMGLGLFLTQTTVQRLGGTLAIAVRAGGGLCCTLTLPLAPVRVHGGER
jgi:two-component system sensor histidine kinase RegB